MSSVDDAFKANANKNVSAGEEDNQSYVILEDHDMDLKDLLAQYEESKEDTSEKKGQK
jgi:hypothetical protein